MEHKQFSALSILKIIKIIFASAFVLWMILGVPTGWLYDLGIGRGTEQGQLPDQSVQTVHTQDEVEDFFFQNTPATVSKNDLILCPLMRLRDKRSAGEFKDSYSKTTREVLEYCIMDHPMTFQQKVFSHFVGLSLYNRYYLAPLDDGSYICVYFDDYRLLAFGDELPTGCIRPAEPEEKKMLHLMTADYEVNTAYVLDMYRHGKVHWILDFAIRFVICIAGIAVAVEVHEKKSKRSGRSAEEVKNAAAERKAAKVVKNTQDDSKFALRKNEVVVGCAQIYSMYMGMNGTIYVTDQRVCFKGNVFGYVYLNIALSDISGYVTGRALLTRSVTIYAIDQKNNRHQYTGLAAKKLQGWLEQVGIRKLS